MTKDSLVHLAQINTWLDPRPESLVVWAELIRCLYRSLVGNPAVNCCSPDSSRWQGTFFFFFHWIHADWRSRAGRKANLSADSAVWAPWGNKQTWRTWWADCAQTLASSAQDSFISWGNQHLRTEVYSLLLGMHTLSIHYMAIRFTVKIWLSCQTPWELSWLRSSRLLWHGRSGVARNRVLQSVTDFWM